MSARQLVVLAIAAIAALGAVFLIRGMASTPAEPVAATTSEQGERVLVVTRDLTQGMSLAASDIEWRAFPAASVGERFVSEASSPDALTDLVGAVTRRAFVAGEPVTQGAVIKRGEQGVLAAQLQLGYRAVSVEIDETSAAGGYIQPNDRVDVILTTTRELDGDANGGVTEEVLSDVILENVRVLAVGPETRPADDEEGAERIDAATAVLELSQADTRTLALADELGALRLVLRGVEAEPPQLEVPSAQLWRARSLEQRAEEAPSVRVHGYGQVQGRNNMARSLQTALAVVLSASVASVPAIGYAQTAEVEVMRITQGGDAANAASLVLPLNKAAIIDLPYDARDILLSNPQIADAVVRTSRRVYVIGRALGQTNAFFFDAQGRQIANVEIRVEPDVAPLNDLLTRHAPESRARAEAVNGSLVLTGTVRSAAEAERVLQIATRFITATGAAGGGAASGGGAGAAAGGGETQIVNLLQVEGSEQVMVRVRVVEMSRTLVRQLGINVNAQNMLNALVPEDVMIDVATQNGYSIAGRALGGLSGEFSIVDTILRPESLTFPGPDASTRSPVGAGVGGFEFDNNGTADPLDDTITNGPAVAEPSSQVDASIEAFERAGLLRVLAEPNITAISGESARFLAGGEFPIPVATDDGEISIEFKPFGVGLAMTPIVLSGGRISLKLATEVSELTNEGAISTGDTVVAGPNGTTQVVRGITIPALQVRRAETTVEMPSGGALVLAGLIQERTRHAIEGIPGAMDTPILGSLFRSRDFINSETELVIIVTPYLVRPTSPDNLRTPADGFANPTERESILMGRLNALYRAPTDESGEPRRLQGPHGHIIQ